MNKHKTILILTVLLLVLSGMLYAQVTDPAELFSKANKHYENSEYEEAISLYEEVTSRDIADKVLYYNLGNAYYRTENLGKALLYYERALKLSPRDEDIQYNIEFIRSLKSRIRYNNC